MRPLTGPRRDRPRPPRRPAGEHRRGRGARRRPTRCRPRAHAAADASGPHPTSLAAGAHVVCEKPLAPTAGETRALLELARDAGRCLVETRNVLYNDVVLRFDRAHRRRAGRRAPRGRRVARPRPRQRRSPDGGSRPPSGHRPRLPAPPRLPAAALRRVARTARHRRWHRQQPERHVGDRVRPRRRADDDRAGAGASADLARCCAERDAGRRPRDERLARGGHLPAVPPARGSAMGRQALADGPRRAGRLADPRRWRQPRAIGCCSTARITGCPGCSPTCTRRSTTAARSPIAEQDMLASATLIDRIVELAGANR